MLKLSQGVRAVARRKEYQTKCPYIFKYPWHAGLPEKRPRIDPVPTSLSGKGFGKQNSLVRLNSRDNNDEASLIMIWHAEKWCSPLLKYFMKLSEEVMSESPVNLY